MKYSILFTDFFKRKLKKLAKKYPGIKQDLAPLLKELENGQVRGDPIQDLRGNVFKIRCASTDMKRGKSGGFRVIYYLETDDSIIYLITIYAKVETENIPANLVMDILRELKIEL